MRLDPKTIAEADDYFGAFLRELTPKQREVARITRDFIRQNVYPSGNKVCGCLGRRGLNQKENEVRYKVYHAYTGTHGVIQSWREQFMRAMTGTGLMFHREIIE
jgi:hypothetical protein